MNARRFGLAVFALLASCGAKQAAIDEVQFGLTTAGVIGLSGTLAMDAIKGPAPACAAVQTACTTYPCTTGSVNITLGGGCPLPLGGAAAGSVSVTGNWSSVDSATLSQTYTNATVAAQNNKALALASVKSVSASRSGTMLTVKFTGADAVASASGSAVAAGGSQSWTVVVNTKGTADPSDDILTVDATGASAGAGLGASARVAKINGAILDPGCRTNPVGGSAEITQVSTFVPTITKIQFHAACDGKAEVDGATQDFMLLP
ncbi:MAG TPA: hypothetical protein PKI03_40340 [Pseudomonadota bacterium]|nr:hypothetical protein [Pseudomonadota bacterium]